MTKKSEAKKSEAPKKTEAKKDEIMAGDVIQVLNKDGTPEGIKGVLAIVESISPEGEITGICTNPVAGSVSPGSAIRIDIMVNKDQVAKIGFAALHLHPYPAQA